MKDFLKDNSCINLWAGESAFFVHNWRCAGSSVNSLLASNFTSSYIKVGMAFGQYGWPTPSVQEVSSLADLRSRFTQGCIIGGHLCTGIQTLLPGKWQVWMNAREPVDRLKSGILRFYASGQAVIREQDLMERTGHMTTAVDLQAILEGQLKRESNGLCRRLAGFSNCQTLRIDHAQTCLERLSLLEEDIPITELASSAIQNLASLDHLFLAEHLHLSILCLEKKYGLAPLINPFSDLRHNPVHLGKPSQTHKDLLEKNSDMLERYVSGDLVLWPRLKRFFKRQVDRCNVRDSAIRVRELIHREPLIDPSWMKPTVSRTKLTKAWARRIAERAILEPELAEELIDTVCSWHRLEEETASRIHFYSYKFFKAMR